jgi:hypothetical protein
LQVVWFILSSRVLLDFIRLLEVFLGKVEILRNSFIENDCPSPDRNGKLFIEKI